MLRKSCIYSIALILIFFSIIFPIQAEEMDQAATFAEMKQWINEHKMTGGTLYLSDDIVIDESYVYTGFGPKPDQDIVIDCGDHTIYVKGMADFTYLYNRVTFQGNNDIFHVEKGAYFAISQGILKSENGKTIVQEEGSQMLQEENTVDLDSIQYANYPTIKVNSKYMPYHTYIQYELADASDFVDGLNVEVFYQGKSYRGWLPVLWNMEELSEIEDLNRYYTMEGSFQGSLSSIHEALSAFDAAEAVYVDSPQATAIWTEDGISIENILKGPSSIVEWILISVDAPEGADLYQLNVRETEGDEWTFVEESTNSNGLSLQLTGNCQFYVQVLYADRKLSSNIINYDGQTFQSAISGGGNRGGGTDLTPEEDEPPYQEPEDNDDDWSSRPKPEIPSEEESDIQKPDELPIPEEELPISTESDIIDPSLDEPEKPIDDKPPVQEPVIPPTDTPINLTILDQAPKIDVEELTASTESDVKNQKEHPYRLPKDNENKQSMDLIKGKQASKTSKNPLLQNLIGITFIVLIISGTVWGISKKRK